MLQIMCTLAEKLCFHVQSSLQSKNQCFVLWPDEHGITISGGKVFLLTFMIKEFWMTGTLSKLRLGILSQDPRWVKGSKLSVTDMMSSDSDPELGVDWSPHCRSEGCLTALVTEVWLGQPSLARGEHCSCGGRGLNCPQPWPGPGYPRPIMHLLSDLEDGKDNKDIDWLRTINIHSKVQ